MEFLVHTSGEVYDIQNKTYVIKASSESQAVEIAKQNFKKEFNCTQINTETQSLKRTKRTFAAGILMFVAIVISLFTYTYKDTFLFFSIEREFSFAPSMQSCILAIIFYASYVIRFKGIARTVATTTDIIFCVLSILLLSSVFELILTTDNLNLLGFIPLPDSLIILIFTIIFSLLGIKLLSVLCMIFIALTAVSNISIANEAMGFLGVIYILCSFMGLLLYLSIEPTVLEALPKIQKSFSGIFKSVKKDFSDARNEADSIVSNVKNNVSSKSSDNNGQ